MISTASALPYVVLVAAISNCAARHRKTSVRRFREMLERILAAVIREAREVNRSRLVEGRKAQEGARRKWVSRWMVVQTVGRRELLMVSRWRVYKWSRLFR